MQIYFDDDSVRAVLIQRLALEGHDLLIPADAGIAGQEDPTHLMCAIRTGRALLTHNYDDFKLLHDLVVLAGGHHPGILVVRRDNDPTRDMSPRAIARSIICFKPIPTYSNTSSGVLADFGIRLAVSPSTRTSPAAAAASASSACRPPM